MGENYCPKAGFCSSNKDGFLKPFYVANKNTLVKIDNSIPSEIAVWSELLSVGVAGARRINMQNRARVALFGDGIMAYIVYLILVHMYNADVTIFGVDENKMKIAEELVRYIEDQFVVWNRPAPWNKDSADTSLWPVPCALEQYNWYVPIDASAANIINTFVAMYKAGRGELYLAKAKALADTITRVQHEDGMIPTHWHTEKALEGDNFWINCMIAAADAVETMSELVEEK